MSLEIAGCASHLHWGARTVLPLPGLDDEEQARLDPGLPPVVDGHVHLFPARLFEAIWRWFDTHGWPIRYKLHAREVIDFLLSRGVTHLVAMHYAHRPGIARELNRWMAEICAGEPRVTGLATVLPGEPDAGAILDEAFDAGLEGVKLHCHVQCFSPDSAACHAIYEACVRRDKPIVVHAGREPKSSAYACDPYELCAVDRVERVLRDYPTLRLCVPHFGADEFDGYLDLLERYDNLWLDTTMMLGQYFHVPDRKLLCEARPERIFYGTDFPNVPYAWSREVAHIAEMGLAEPTLEQILGGTATEFFRLDRLRA